MRSSSGVDPRRARTNLRQFGIEDRRVRTHQGRQRTGDAIRDRRARMELRRGVMVVLFEGFARFNIETDQATINVLPSCLFRIDVDEPERV